MSLTPAQQPNEMKTAHAAFPSPATPMRADPTFGSFLLHPLAYPDAPKRPKPATPPASEVEYFAKLAREQEAAKLLQQQMQAQGMPPPPPPPKSDRMPSVVNRTLTPEELQKFKPEEIYTYECAPLIPGIEVEYATIMVGPMYEAERDKGEFPVRVPRSYLKYDLRAKYIGSPALIYLNPADDQFYEEVSRLPHPVLNCWLLINHMTFKKEAGSYVKRRLVEEALRNNIQTYCVHPNRFDLLVSKDGFDGLVYEGKQLPLPDCLISRVGASVGYFGLAVLRQLESLGVHIFNNTQAVEIARQLGTPYVC